MENTNAEVQKGAGAQQTGGWTKHAPPGGIYIGGKYYKGGRFIPNAEFEKASETEKKELSDRLNNKLQPLNEKNIVDKMSPEEYEKEIEGGGTSQNKPYKEDKSVEEPLYIFDNGGLLGQKKYLGYLIIRNNPVGVPVVFAKELKMLAALNTSRFDIIIPSANKVISILSPNTIWPTTKETTDINIFDQFQTIKEIQIIDIPIEDYPLKNSINPALREILFSSSVSSHKMSLDEIDKSSIIDLDSIILAKKIIQTKKVNQEYPIEQSTSTRKQLSLDRLRQIKVLLSN